MYGSLGFFVCLFVLIQSVDIVQSQEITCFSLTNQTAPMLTVAQAMTTLCISLHYTPGKNGAMKDMKYSINLKCTVLRLLTVSCNYKT